MKVKAPLALALVSCSTAAFAGDVEFNPFKFKAAASPGMDGWFKDAKLGMFMHWYVL